MTATRLDQDLRASYDACRRLHRRHDPTYYWATRRLPADVRPATHALYGYVRIADEIVDGPRRAADPETRRAELDAWERQLESPVHPAARALVHAAGHHRLPLGELGPYIASMRVDCAPVRISGRDELESYMDGSAGTVGRIMASLLGVPEAHRADFGRLGRAFQLTNFLRDVREDRRLDRVYLPADERERLGVDEAQLDAETASGPLRALIALEVARAREMFAECEPAVAAAPRSVRPGIRVAVGVYRAVLDRLEAVDFDVLGRATGPGPLRVAGAAVQGLRG